MPSLNLGRCAFGLSVLLSTFTVVNSDDAQAVDCQQGFEAFQTEFLPVMASRKKCGACHAGNFASAPQFIFEESEQTYRAIKNYISMNNFADSVLFEKAGNSHCKFPNCNSTSGEVIANAGEAWWVAGENQCTPVWPIQTKPIKVPTDLPTVEQGFAVVSWDLGEVDEQLSGAELVLEIQRFQQQTSEWKGAYQFRKPYIKGLAETISVSGLRVLVNRNWDALSNAYVDVNGFFSASHVGSDVRTGLLSTRPLIVFQDMDENDYISVAFDELSVAEQDVVPTCNAPEVFAQTVGMSFSARNCSLCHGGGLDDLPGRAPANAAFSMRGTLEQVCQRTLQRTNLDFMYYSGPIMFGLRGQFGHPILYVNQDEIIPLYRSWLQAEADVDSYLHKYSN